MILMARGDEGGLSMRSMIGIVIGVLSLVSVLHAQEAPPPKPLKVLLVGNSYTDQIQAALETVFRAAELDPERVLKVIAPGGWTLQRHADEPDLARLMATGGWSHVVLQEQSQHPAYPGLRERYLTAATTLIGRVRAAGAQPVIFATWGYRDGDSRNPGLAGDYDAMQKLLSAGFEALRAQHPTVVIAPVDRAWAALRQRDAELGRRLYAPDGSHPAPPGAHLAACVIYQALTGRTAPACANSPLSEAEGRLVAEAVAASFAPR
jgi:hypothetical protein